MNASTSIAGGRGPGFFSGWTYPLRGLAHLVRRPALWKWAILPLALNVLLYSLLAWALTWFVSDRLLDEGGWLTSWPPALRWTVAILSGLAGAILMAYSFTSIGNLVAAPLLDYLSENALVGLRGRPLPEGPSWLAGALHAVGRKAANLAIFGAVQLALLVVFFIPVVGLLYPALAAAVTIFYFAYEFLDYPLGADRVSFGGRFAYVRRHFAPAMGFGCALFVMIFVPLLSYVALPACVVGATLLYHELEPEPPPRTP